LCSPLAPPPPLRRDVRCSAKNAPAKMFYWKDGELVTVSEDDMPLEARPLSRLALACFWRERPTPLAQRPQPRRAHSGNACVALRRSGVRCVAPVCLWLAR
jgi:hypothetical protein